MSQALAPIVVDLDDTLAKTDFFYESLLKFIKQNPFNFFRAVFWLISKDKAYLKSQIAKVVEINASLIPYNVVVIEWIKSKKLIGHQVILATATHRVFADSVANYLNIFDHVFATDDNQNLKGINKEKKLIELYGEQGFIYVGDSQADLKVWRSAQAAVIVSSSKKLLEEVESVTKIEKVIPTNRNEFSVQNLFRPAPWLNILPVFLALILFGDLNSSRDWFNIIIAFFSLGSSAIAISIFDDLFNLDVSRLDASRELNPFAVGKLAITKGVSIALTCLLISLGLGVCFGAEFIVIVVIYFLMAFGYVVYLKSIIPKPLAISILLLVPIFAGYLVVIPN